ncbi:MAG: esterase family protein [Armatimonadaceae bacterium]
MNREYHRWHSPHLGREMELLIFGHGGARVIVFPTRDGRFYDFENWKLVAAIADKIEAGYFQLYCVDSNDRNSLYADWMQPKDRMPCQVQYEKYIVEEVLPFSEKRNPLPFVVSCGCSLGAYHAMNIGLKHPDRFGKIVSLSGRYDLTRSMGSFRDLFDGYYDDLIYFNNPAHYIPRIEDEALLTRLRRLQITFAIGEEDAFYPNNVEFAEILTHQQIQHQFSVWTGEAHKPRYWRQMLPMYL